MCALSLLFPERMTVAGFRFSKLEYALIGIEFNADEYYVLCGEKGVPNSQTSPEQLCKPELQLFIALQARTKKTSCKMKLESC